MPLYDEIIGELVTPKEGNLEKEQPVKKNFSKIESKDVVSFENLHFYPRAFIFLPSKYHVISGMFYSKINDLDSLIVLKQLLTHPSIHSSTHPSI